MPKRRHDDDDEYEGGGNGKNEAGRNCYTKKISTERLEKAQERLQSLIDAKCALEDNLEKSLAQIEVVSAKIAELECKVEKMVAEFGAKECVDRMKAEILAIKEDRAKAEKEVNRYKSKIVNKLKKLEHCKKTFGGNGGGGNGNGNGSNGGNGGNGNHIEDECQ